MKNLVTKLLDNSFYINLDEREDRKNHLIHELKKIGIENCKRISAIKKNPGIIGCLLSHIKAAEEGLKSDSEFTAIFEDDVIFLNPEETLNGIKQLENDKDWNVLLLGGMNNGGKYKKYKNLPCIQVTECMSCASYIIRNNYIKNLINIWKESYKLYEEKRKNTKKLINVGYHAPDTSWFSLQKKDIFVLLIPLNVSQLKGFSNCWNENVNHSRNMLSLETKKMFENVCHNCKKSSINLKLIKLKNYNYGLNSCEICKEKVKKICEGFIIK